MVRVGLDILANRSCLRARFPRRPGVLDALAGWVAHGTWPRQRYGRGIMLGCLAGLAVLFSLSGASLPFPATLLPREALFTFSRTLPALKARLP